jgi:hypothetical protein
MSKAREVTNAGCLCELCAFARNSNSKREALAKTLRTAKLAKKISMTVSTGSYFPASEPFKYLSKKTSIAL